jgi:hypothetical protein
MALNLAGAWIFVHTSGLYAIDHNGPKQVIALGLLSLSSLSPAPAASCSTPDRPVPPPDLVARGLTTRLTASTMQRIVVLGVLAECLLRLLCAGPRDQDPEAAARQGDDHRDAGALCQG